jgi:hypothetical protein
MYRYIQFDSQYFCGHSWMDLFVNGRGEGVVEATKRSRGVDLVINDTAINDAYIILTEARLSAQQDTLAFETEAGIIVKVKESLNLTIDDVLAYMSNRRAAGIALLTIGLQGY